MIKMKLLFRVKLLILVLSLLNLMQSVAFGGTSKKEFTVDGPDRVCGRGRPVTYSTSYKIARSIAWEITGGMIVEINGLAIPQFYTEYMPGETPPKGAIVKFEYNTLESGSVTFIENGKESTVEIGQEILYALVNNPANTITVDWATYGNSGIVYTSSGKVTAQGRGLGELGVDGAGISTKTTVFEGIPQISLTAPVNLNLTCNQGAQLNCTSYTSSIIWSTSGAVVTNNWGTGIYIDHFNQVGQVPITVIASNTCGSKQQTTTFNITQPDFGHVQQNGANVDDPGTLVSLDCQGNFNLGMPVWVSNNAVYTWELPGDAYNIQTNTYTKTIISGVNKQNIQGRMPAGGYTDFVGKVTITGVCGAPVVKTFIIRPTLSPSVDADIFSCSNSVSIHVNNPTGTTNVNAWVASTRSGSGYGSFVNPTPTSVTFIGAQAEDYEISIGLNVGACYTQLHTTVHTQSSNLNNNSSAAGWQSGVLSDNRQEPGSNIVAYGGNIYFSGRDGKMYYYNFSTALQKWVINSISGITNAAIPASGAFTKIGVATVANLPYLFYAENTTGKLWKIDLSANLVSPAFSPSINASDFITMGSDVYAIDKGTNALTYNSALTPFTLSNAILKAIIPGYGITYVQNNDLYSTWFGQLTYSGDVYASSDVVYYNGFLYFARGQKGSANLYRVPMPNPNQVEQITTSSNLSGIFNINPASGVIYYGIMNLGSANTIYTQASGSYKAADIYQAHLSGTAWIFNKATVVVNYEGLDMLISSAVYSGNHLYYIGSGHYATSLYRELEVWNLYYENACAPALQRVAATTQNIPAITEVLVYPNPFNTELMIDLSTYTEDGNITSLAVEVLDATGKKIYSSSLPSQLAKISTQDWASGMYVIQIQYKDQLINKKVVKY
jgi:hypothetical protein